MNNLSEEKQDKDNLSLDSIDWASDPGVQRIKQKYSDQIIKNHNDEQRFSDEEVQAEARRLKQQEHEEIEVYKKQQRKS